MKAMLLKDSAVAEMLSVTRMTVWNWVKDGILPKPIKIGGSTRWRLADTEAVIEERGM